MSMFYIFPLLVLFSISCMRSESIEIAGKGDLNATCIQYLKSLKFSCIEGTVECNDTPHIQSHCNESCPGVDNCITASEEIPASAPPIDPADMVEEGIDTDPVQGAEGDLDLDPDPLAPEEPEIDIEDSLPSFTYQSTTTDISAITSLGEILDINTFDFNQDNANDILIRVDNRIRGDHKAFVLENNLTSFSLKTDFQFGGVGSGNWGNNIYPTSFVGGDAHAERFLSVSRNHIATNGRFWIYQSNLETPLNLDRDIDSASDWYDRGANGVWDVENYSATTSIFADVAGDGNNRFFLSRRKNGDTIGRIKAYEISDSSSNYTIIESTDPEPYSTVSSFDSRYAKQLAKGKLFSNSDQEQIIAVYDSNITTNSCDKVYVYDYNTTTNQYVVLSLSTSIELFLGEEDQCDDYSIQKIVTGQYSNVNQDDIAIIFHKASNNAFESSRIMILSFENNQFTIKNDLQPIYFMSQVNDLVFANMIGNDDNEIVLGMSYYLSQDQFQPTLTINHIVNNRLEIMDTYHTNDTSSSPIEKLIKISNGSSVLGSTIGVLTTLPTATLSIFSPTQL